MKKSPRSPLLRAMQRAHNGINPCDKVRLVLRYPDRSQPGYVIFSCPKCGWTGGQSHGGQVVMGQRP